MFEIEKRERRVRHHETWNQIGIKFQPFFLFLRSFRSHYLTTCLSFRLLSAVNQHLLCFELHVAILDASLSLFPLILSCLVSQTQACTACLRLISCLRDQTSFASLSCFALVNQSCISFFSLLLQRQLSQHSSTHFACVTAVRL